MRKFLSLQSRLAGQHLIKSQCVPTRPTNRTFVSRTIGNATLLLCDVNGGVKTNGLLIMGCTTSRLGISTSNTTTKDDVYVEDVVCQDGDIKENEMKSFELGDAGKVLLVRQNGKLSAIGSKCTHYGAPLETGALGEGRIRCPWHGACFNIANGDIEDFPGLDSLPCYEVKVENNNVKVRAKKSDLQSNKRVKTMCKMDSGNDEKIVVIGGGPAGATCVETLRQEGFTGKITMICKENYLPYDRVKVSKSMDVDIEKIQLRSDAFYKEHDIEVLKNTEAVSVDTQANSVSLNNGKKLDYTKIFIATGSKAMKANIPGAELGKVVVIRNYDDAKYIRQLLNKEMNVVVLGASFIAMEAASYCVDKVKSVTVIGRDQVPFRQLLGTEIGSAFKTLFEEKGIKFVMNSGMKACIGDGEGNIQQVELVNGDRLEADLCIMGVGGAVNTEFLKNSGIELTKNGSIEVNEFMQSNVQNVYVGGDIAFAPVYSNDNLKSAIGHYPLAHYHGKIAAMNMTGKATPLKAVPFFWTMLFGKGIRYSGHGKYDNILYSGNVQELKFVAYYMKDDRVVAISSCGRDPIVSKYAELRAQGKDLLRNDLGEDLLAWTR